MKLWLVGCLLIQTFGLTKLKTKLWFVRVLLIQTFGTLNQGRYLTFTYVPICVAAGIAMQYVLVT